MFLIGSTFINSDHSSHRDNDGRYRDRDARRPGRGDFHRSSSFNRYILISSVQKMKPN
jgi:hypothetical protein